MSKKLQPALRLFWITLITFFTISLQAAENDILIGQINAQTGGGASLGKPLALGAQVYLDSINARGGIKSRKIRLITLDDEFKEAKTQELAQELITKHSVLALINTVGAPNIDNLITSQFLDRHHLVVLGPLTNSTTVRERRNHHVFFVRAGLREEIDAMVRQVEILGFKRVGIFYQNDTSGRDGLKLIEQALASKGLNAVASANYERQDFKADQAAEVFRKTKPDVILTISVAAATSILVRNVGRSISSGVMVIANSGNSVETLQKLLGTELARGLAIVQVMPSLSNTALPLIKDFKADFARYAPPEERPNAFSLEGYITAKILCTALAQIQGQPDRKKLMQALESMRLVSLGGYILEFDKNKRLGSSYAEVAVLNGEGKLVR